jgi:hypothetical protein
VISLQVGDCWLWSLIIFLIQKSCFSRVWIPFPDGGVPGGQREILEPPPGKEFGGSALKEKFWERLPCKLL